MATVTGEFPDYSGKQHNNKGWFTVASDKGFDPFRWRPPINWTGLVNGKEVNFVQISSSGSLPGHYIWDGFPEDCKGAIDSIVAAIDKAMRTMD
jgi:hypothetical protein